MPPPPPPPPLRQQQQQQQQHASVLRERPPPSLLSAVRGLLERAKLPKSRLQESVEVSALTAGSASTKNEDAKSLGASPEGSHCGTLKSVDIGQRRLLPLGFFCPGRTKAPRNRGACWHDSTDARVRMATTGAWRGKRRPRFWLHSRCTPACCRHHPRQAHLLGTARETLGQPRSSKHMLV